MEYVENSKISGFEPELINAMAKEMGRNIELKNIGWDELFDKLYTGESNALVSAITI
jgi:glutamine transport system substrate-binding protein